jgi:hypothetical protein
MKLIKIILKICRFSLPVDNIVMTITPKFYINMSNIMYFFSIILFCWCCVIDIITPFTMPYNLINTLIFLGVTVGYTVFLWYLIKYKIFNYSWFFYTIILMWYVIYHLPIDMIQPNLWPIKHLYAVVDALFILHTGFYNLLGFCSIYQRIIYVFKD